MSPRSFINRPPAKPERFAEVYFCVAVAVAVEVEVADVADEFDVMDAAEVEREKGEEMAVERRKGFDEDEDTGGEEAGTLVCNGGSEGAWIDTGRPPGVRDREIDGPGWSVSLRPVGVPALPVRGGISVSGVDPLKFE